MPVCCAAQAVPFHLFMDPIKEVGDQWTLNGDLGDFVGGFGNVDIPIWRGGWSSGSGPPRGARGPTGSLPR